MRIRVGMENGMEGRSMAWVLDYPGCFCYGADAAEAVVGVPRALLDYYAWTEKNYGKAWLPPLGDFDIRIVDAWQCYTINEKFELAEEGYDVNAWFLDDWRPLSAEEAARGGQLLRWSRADLTGSVRNLGDDILDEKRPGERWSIRGILRHVANAEHWYLHRLGLAGMTRADFPADVFETLALVRARLEQVLPDLAGSDKVVGVDGEFWSPRKLLRRAIWHELDHRDHIRKLLEKG